MVYLFSGVNILAIFVVTIISMIIGWLWYSNVLFGKTWIKLMNISKKDIEKAKKKGMTKSYIIMFISALIMNYVLALFVDYAGSFALGMRIGFFIWLGFFATTMIGSVLWENKPFKLYLINTFHYLVALIISGGILAIWI